MPDQRLIDGLIGTYRDLNFMIRTRPEAELTAVTTGDQSVRNIMERMRDSELRFSQALKERVSGVHVPDNLEHEKPIIGMEHDDDSTRVMLSQFGTARESTLTMLRDLSDAEMTNAPEGARSIADRLQQLVESDREHVERITQLLGVRMSAPA